MSLRDIAAARARSLELEATQPYGGMRVNEFYNQCHDENGRFCEGEDGPGRVRDNVGRRRAEDIKREVLSNIANSVVREVGDPSISKDVNALYTNRQKIEPIYTKVLQNVAKETGGKLQGVENRLKSAKSIADRIQRSKAKNPEWTTKQALDDLSDTLRFTVTFPEKDYVEGVKNAVRQLQANGVRFDKAIKNVWEFGGQYAGMNATATDTRTGLPFEVQFHTEDSFKTKSNLHEYYEFLRNKRGNKRQRARVWEVMRRQSDAVNRPPGWRELDGEVEGVKFSPAKWDLGGAESGPDDGEDENFRPRIRFGGFSSLDNFKVELADRKSKSYKDVSEIPSLAEAERLFDSGEIDQIDWEDFIDSVFGYRAI